MLISTIFLLCMIHTYESGVVDEILSGTPPDNPVEEKFVEIYTYPHRMFSDPITGNQRNKASNDFDKFLDEFNKNQEAEFELAKQNAETQLKAFDTSNEKKVSSVKEGIDKNLIEKSEDARKKMHDQFKEMFEETKMHGSTSQTSTKNMNAEMDSLTKYFGTNAHRFTNDITMKQQMDTEKYANHADRWNTDFKHNIGKSNDKRIQTLQQETGNLHHRISKSTRNGMNNFEEETKKMMKEFNIDY